MGLQYNLVNLDKKEIITFFKVNTGTKFKELCSNQIAGNIISHYLLKNIGNRISFIDDSNPTQHLFGTDYTSSDFSDFTDITNKVIDELIKLKILTEFDPIIIDEEDKLFYRNLKNLSEY